MFRRFSRRGWFVWCLLFGVTPAQDFYAPNASKYGQPRTTGTNPHTGVDFQTISPAVRDGKRRVDPVGIGTVVSVDKDDWGIVAIRLDWDQDGILDDLYAVYTHLYESVAAGHVVLYHRVDGTGPWTISTMHKLDDAFWLNLRSLYTPGTVINLFARASRSAVQPSYNYSLMKPKYYQPNNATLASPFYGGQVAPGLKPYFIRIVP